MKIDITQRKAKGRLTAIEVLVLVAISLFLAVIFLPMVVDLDKHQTTMLSQIGMLTWFATFVSCAV